MKRTVLALFFALCLAAPALAQSNPGLAFGQVPTPAQWNSYFAAKQDYLNASPCLVTGCVFTGPVTVPSVIAGGSPPSNTGTCTITSQVGGNTAGRFNATGAGCSNNSTIIFTFATTAPNGWACDAEDLSTTNDTVQQTASTQTTASFKNSAIGPSDLISFKCVAY